MRRITLSIGLVLLSCSLTMAQSKKEKKKMKEKAEAAAAVSATAAPSTPALPAQPATVSPDDMVFTDMVHDFGTIVEGPDATCVFTFKNNAKEPIVIQKAQPSCGCTVPQFSNEPVAPGGTGTINVAYHSKGKPGPFNKNITVTSNAGMKVLTIKGNVEKAPTSSVPENTSLMKIN
jgi:hypothetical protein